VKILLDTQLAVWAVLNDSRLGAAASRHILDPSATLFVSVASLWEIAIKHKLPKRSDPMPFSARRAQELFEAADYVILPIAPEHAAAVDDLPAHHGDPFDRMLVAQALTEPMRLLTRDGRLRAYGDLIVVA
jgi:PIN domain nuclease of toxin-antitoxin system